MKKLFGFFVLLILLVAVSGCAQLQPAPVTTPSPTPLATPEPTPVPTAVETPVAPVATAVVTLETPLPSVTPSVTEVVTNVTASLPTVAATPHVSLTPQTKITIFSMTNNTFTPKELTVLPGTGISWRNDDSVNHVVKGTTEAGTTMFKSADIIPGASWSYTFGDRTGTFTITDPGYPQMKCIIIVKEGQNFQGSL